MGMQKIKWWALVLALLSLLVGSQFACAEEAAPTFKVSKVTPNAKAEVEGKTITVDMAFGNRDDYTSKKKFDLIVGGCTLSITGSTYDVDDIQYKVEEGEATERSFYKDSMKFTATEDGVAMSGKKDNGGPNDFTFCKKSDDGPSVKFEPHPDKNSTKSLITVELKGDDIPSGLVLTSTAPLFNETAKDGEGEGKSFEAWKIAVIACSGVLVLILLVGGGVGTYFFIKRKKNKQQADAAVMKPGSAVSTAKTPSKESKKSKGSGDKERSQDPNQDNEASAKSKMKRDEEADAPSRKRSKRSAREKKRGEEESVMTAPPKVPKSRHMRPSVSEQPRDPQLSALEQPEDPAPSASGQPAPSASAQPGDPQQ